MRKKGHLFFGRETAVSRKGDISWLGPPSVIYVFHYLWIFSYDLDVTIVRQDRNVYASEVCVVRSILRQSLFFCRRCRILVLNYFVPTRKLEFEAEDY